MAEYERLRHRSRIKPSFSTEIFQPARFSTELHSDSLLLHNGLAVFSLSRVPSQRIMEPLYPIPVDHHLPYGHNPNTQHRPENNAHTRHHCQALSRQLSLSRLFYFGVHYSESIADRGWLVISSADIGGASIDGQSQEEDQEHPAVSRYAKGAGSSWILPISDPNCPHLRTFLSDDLGARPVPLLEIRTRQQLAAAPIDLLEAVVHPIRLLPVLGHHHHRHGRLWRHHPAKLVRNYGGDCDWDGGHGRLWLHHQYYWAHYERNEVNR